jgi:hypothetical protein
MQLTALKKHFPSGSGQIGASRKGRRLKWRQSVRPHALGALYTIELRLFEGRHWSPEVLLIEPDPRDLADGRRLPHVYREVDGHVRLCLFCACDWSPDKFVANTLIPWAGDWLFFFENWLVTDTWLGGGTHPIGPQLIEESGSEPSLGSRI